MEIKKFIENKTLTVELFGRLDIAAAPEFDEMLKNSTDQVKYLIIDFRELDYIASAGLRVLLKYQKKFERDGSVMKIKNVKPEVLEVFKISGFYDFLNIVDNHSKRISIEF